MDMSILNNLKRYRLILASNSPRRQELLGGLGLEFEVKTKADIDESYPEDLVVEEVAKYVTSKKAKAYLDELNSGELLITADTIVVVEDKVLGKPKSREEALEMLTLLSGKKHRVITAVCLLSKEKKVLFDVTTMVEFANLTLDEMEYYLDVYKPYDKAGAYGVQEWIGYIGVVGMQGSFYNVMGLPVQSLYRELKEF